MAMAMVQRAHHRFLDAINDEFDRRGRSDISSTQALLIYNIGDEQIQVVDLRKRGYYLGSNVSYNLKKLVESGYLDHRPCRDDRRSVHISLTAKGREVRDIVVELYAKHAHTLKPIGGVSEKDLGTVADMLHRLEKFRTDQITYRL